MSPVLIMLLALACAWDVGLHRIPNALVVGIAATGLLAHAMRGGAVAAGWSALAVLIVAAIAWPAWTRQWVGGGDLKLAAAAAAWLSVYRIPIYLVVSAIAIGALSVACYALSSRGARAEVRRNLAFAAKGVIGTAPLGAERGRVRVPAGAGFALGAMVTLALTGGL